MNIKITIQTGTPSEDLLKKFMKQKASMQKKLEQEANRNLKDN